MKILKTSILLFLAILGTFASCKKESPPPATGTVQLAGVKVGSQNLDLVGSNQGIAPDTLIVVEFNNQMDPGSIQQGISLVKDNDSLVAFTSILQNGGKTIQLITSKPLIHQSDYTLKLTTALKGSQGETFPGLTISFSTEYDLLTIDEITINGIDFSQEPVRHVDWKSMKIEIGFSYPLNPDDYASYFFVSGGFQKEVTLSDDHKVVTIDNLEELTHYQRYYFSITNSLEAKNGSKFNGFNNSFYTKLDSTPKFETIPDEALLDLIQEKTFNYFYEFAHPNSGLARERNTSNDIVTSGGSGFGVMALIVGMERNFISRTDGTGHLDKMLDFLETCDRFHGAWPHWINGSTGKVQAFSPNDDGADLVETSFMIQGLFTMRQYLDPVLADEQLLIDRINTLIDEVEWDWFTRNQQVLYWHWSPNVGWAMNMKIRGHNETLISYVLAASSTTHGISPPVYHEGYAQNGGIINGNSYYDYVLPLGSSYGGPLFFTHYSFLGLDPRNLSDTYANYWEQNVNHSLINWSYCLDNPKNFVGYNAFSWGLTASDNPSGYSAHSPTNDLGVITPTAAVSSLPYTPDQSMDAIHHFYYILGDKLWGPYGFYDAFDATESWWANSYLAIDQGPIVCMIENSRTGLLWDLFMSAPEIQQGLTTLGFSY